MKVKTKDGELVNFDEIVIYDDNDEPLFNIWNFDDFPYFSIIHLSGKIEIVKNEILPSSNVINISTKTYY